MFTRRSFFGAVAKMGAGAAAGGVVPTGVEPGAVLAAVTCPMCGRQQPTPQAVAGTPLPDHMKSMRRVQIATCYSDDCRARFAVRWVGDAAR